MKNIKENPKLDRNTIDQISRHGSRFKRTGEIFERAMFSTMSRIRSGIDDRPGGTPIVVEGQSWPA
jgi:hypothetical protein